MIDHLGGGQRFVDLLSLARKIDQELHAVGLDVAVFAHEANYLFVSFARAFRIHPQFPDDSCDRVAAVFAHKLHGSQNASYHFLNLLRLFDYPVTPNRESARRHVNVIGGDGDFPKAVPLGAEVVRGAKHCRRNRARFQRGISLRRSAEVDQDYIAVRIQSVF